MTDFKPARLTCTECSLRGMCFKVEILEEGYEFTIFIPEKELVPYHQGPLFTSEVTSISSKPSWSKLEVGHVLLVTFKSTLKDLPRVGDTFERVILG